MDKHETERAVLNAFDHLPGASEIRVLMSAYRGRHGPVQFGMIMRKFGGEALSQVPFAQWNNLAKALRDGLQIQ